LGIRRSSGLKHEQVVTKVPEVIECREQFGRVVVQIRDQHHQSPAGEQLGRLMQRPDRIGPRMLTDPRQRRQQAEPVIETAAGVVVFDDLVGEQGQSHGIALMGGEVGEAGGQ
jgi:hypothetical protein